jgi:hypothetical protein
MDNVKPNQIIPGAKDFNELGENGKDNGKNKHTIKKNKIENTTSLGCLAFSKISRRQNW